MKKKNQLKDNLAKINLDCNIELDLSKTFQDHFKTLEIPTSSSGSDVSSDSNSESSSSSEEPEEPEEANFLENHLAF